MSLSGNLGFVSLDEVLRLLTRSNQKGSVEVRGQAVRGRIYVVHNGVTLATTSGDEVIRHHLIRSGLVDEDFLLRVESGETTLVPSMDDVGGAIVDFLREMTVDNVYKLGMNGETFEVEEGEETRYASPEPFDIESIIEDSKQRLADWTEISKTVPDLDRAMTLSRDLGERDAVSINRNAWRVLSGIGSGASVVSIAAELGTTDFWAASVAASLIGDELIVASEAGSVEPTQTSAATIGTYSEPEALTEPVAEVMPDFETVTEPVVESEPEPAVVSELEPVVEPEPDAEVVTESDDEELDHSESWWTESKDEDSEPDAEEDASPKKPGSIFGAYAPGASGVPAAVVKEDLSDIPTAGAGEEASKVEEDTEAFLEKVFSELDTPSDEEEQGYGLLRRRRMGFAKDSSGDA